MKRTPVRGEMERKLYNAFLPVRIVISTPQPSAVVDDNLRLSNILLASLLVK
jgi:hypothetical protein